MNRASHRSLSDAGKPPASRLPKKTATRAADFGKGLAAVAVIFFLLFGVPLLLIDVVGMPIGQLIADLTDSLTSDSTKAAAALRLGLSAIVWLAWLQVAWALLIEMMAAVRGRVAGHSRLLFPSFQRTARDLVAIAMLMLVAFSAAPVGATALIPLTAPESAPDLRVDGDDSSAFSSIVDPMVASAQTAGSTPQTSLGSAGGSRDYVVQPGDTFWSLAETGLGDGFRWREIRELNEGRVVGDGVTITGETENLQPGWSLRLPTEAVQQLSTGSGAPTAAALETQSSAEVESSVTVDSGDHFWGLARETLTTEWGREPTEAELSPFWSDMVAINQTQLLPPGDADMIYAGQTFAVPPIPSAPESSSNLDVAEEDPDPAVVEETAAQAIEHDGGNAVETATAPVEDDVLDTHEFEAAPTSTPTTTKPRPGRPVESTSTSVVEANEVEPATAEPDHTADRGDADQAAAESDPADESDRPENANDADDPAEPDANIPVGLVAISGVGLVTAAIGGIMRRSQARQLGVRRPGTTPQFDTETPAERLITETSDQEALDELDTVLRYLGADLAAADLAMPEIVGALIESDSIRLLVANPHRAAPEPLRVERDGMVWIAPRPVPPLDVRRAQNPFPLLVAVGFTKRAQLLVNLEYVGALGLDGGFADVVDVMGTMALQLATSPMADTVEILCVGFGEELTDLERVTIVGSLDEAEARIEARAAEVAALVEASENDAPTGRAAGVGDWTPLVVFDPLSELNDGTKRLLATAALTSAAGVSVVVATTEGTSLSMELSQDRVVIPDYRVNLDRRALTRTERTALSTAVERAKSPLKQESANLVDLLAQPSAGLDPTIVEPPETVIAIDDDGAAETATDTPNSETPEVMVRVLGPLRVQDEGGAALQFARSATPEFIAYLAHHRAGIEAGRAMTTLWPSTTARRTWIANVHADARRTLAAFNDGVVLAPNPGADDEYRLSTQVGSDLELFRALVADAVSLPREQAMARLIDALGLVEGVPYTNITSRWPVTEGHWQDATVMIDEAARCVATLALDHSDNPGLAEWATAKGLLASPQSVELHRLRLRAAIALGTATPDTRFFTADASAAPPHADGATPGLSPDAVFQHYQAVAMADDHRPEGGSKLDPELVELYDSYKRSQLSTSGRPSANDLDTVDEPSVGR